MNRRYVWRVIGLIVFALAGLLVFNWQNMWSDENPITVERAKANIRHGTGYVELVEGEKYVTNDQRYAMLMSFIEGHYGYEFLDFAGDEAHFDANGTEVRYTLTPISGFTDDYIIWEKK